VSATALEKVRIIDSHTGGEPTRVVVSGGPDLGEGTAREQLAVFKAKHDLFRAAIVNEPRGSDVLVGALLTVPAEKRCVTGVIFFNNVGCLGMCGHGTIGLVVTLAHLGRIRAGEHWIETPVGVVGVTLHDDATVSVKNVASYRKAKGVTIKVPGIGSVTGDVAWGGNWFFLVEEHGQKLELGNVEKLTEYTWQVRQAINTQGFPEIDHVELFGGAKTAGANSRNFVLCPGKAYDRSPCGTGTSAKLACLYADGKIKPGEVWRQESILGSIFEGSITLAGEEVIPTIKGSAFINSEATFIFNSKDPFCWGIRA
jgi:4-hydroxyproline epimerase